MNDDIFEDPVSVFYSVPSTTSEWARETQSGDEKGSGESGGALYEPSPTWRGRPFDNRRSKTRQTSAMASAEFWKLWVLHRDYLFQLAMRWMSGNKADAEDLLSRACIKAHDRYLRDEDRIRNLRSWIARLLHNCCMDEHRKRVARGRILEQFHPDQINFLSLYVTGQEIPEQLTDVNETMGQVCQAIMAMPMRIRHPFVLRFIYQYSNQEIATLLSITEVNVRKRIQIGRSMVRDTLPLPD